MDLTNDRGTDDITYSYPSLPKHMMMKSCSLAGHISVYNSSTDPIVSDLNRRLVIVTAQHPPSHHSTTRTGKDVTDH